MQKCFPFNFDENSHLRRDLQNDEAHSCLRDGDCRDGYCVLTKCWNGTINDRCLRNSQCDDTLVCRLAGRVKGQRCLRKLQEGKFCLRDSECLGYCQNLRCWDGTDGDICSKNSDCQGGLTCKRRRFLEFKKCTNV